MLFFIDAYAIVSLFKEHDIDKQETATKRNTKDPEFNEVLEFEVNTDYTTPLSTFSLVVSLNNRSIVGKDEVLGHVIFSVSSPQQPAADHWNAVVNNPHQYHIQWHNLIEPEEL